MTSSADREPPQDANPYQSPAHSGWADDPVALLQERPGGAIEVRGSLRPKDVFWAHFYTSCGFIGFSLLQVGMAGLVLVLGIGASILLLFFARLQTASVLFWLVLAGIEASVLLLLMVIWRQWMSGRSLKRLWNERRGIFSDQVRRVMAEGILVTLPDEQTETLWADYAYYLRSGDQLQLYLRKPAVLLRRQRRAEGGTLWKAGKRWYDGIDIFPRDQFASREEWNLFVRLVKKKVRWW